MVVLMMIVMVTGLASPSRADDKTINLRRTVVVDVVEKTKDSVVYISTTRTQSVQYNPFGGDPFFAPFSQTFQQRVGSLGSGFIVHSDGYVVTNHHVIAGAREIRVELLDGRKLPAELISSNPDADLAVLKIKSDKPLPALELGDSADLMIGEPVIAVGNPMGFSHSVSTGIVSAVHRDLSRDGSETGLKDVIQTDAAINPGNSGGPLLNAYGQVIGINTAIRSDAQNIGFAIPVNRLRDLIPDLMSPEHVRKIDLPIKFKETRTVTEPSTVHSVVRDDGTDEEVKTIAGHAPRDVVDAYAILLRQKPDSEFTVTTDKGSQKIKGKPLPLPDVIVQAKEKLGLTVEQMTPVLAEKRKTDQEGGILINGVERNSIGWNAGLQPGDIIVQIGQYPVNTLDDLAVLLKYMPKKGRAYVGVVRPKELRSGHTFFDLGS
jgi:serine protease Do